MAGHMGDAQITVKNLVIVEVHAENGELYIKGAIPGGRNGLIVIKGEGDLKISKSAVAETEIETATPEIQPVEEVKASVKSVEEVSV